MTTTATRDRDHSLIHMQRTFLQAQRNLVDSPPKGLVLDPQGLTVEAELTIQSAEDFTRQLLARVNADNWWIGDWAAAMSGDPNVGPAEAIRILTQHHAEPARVNRCTAVSVAFPAPRRHPRLSWSHHDVLHQLDSEDRQDEWLRRAADNGWSARRLARELEDARLAAQGDLDLGQPVVVPPLPHRAAAVIFGRNPEAKVVFDAATGALVEVVPAGDGTWVERRDG